MSLNPTALGMGLPAHMVNDPEYIQALRDKLNDEYGGEDGMADDESEDDGDE